MNRIEPLRSIFEKLTPEVQYAINELEDRGLVWCQSFGFSNAIAILNDMDRAFQQGWLYEWFEMRGIGQ